METGNTKLDVRVQEHLKKLVKTAGLPDSPDSLESLTKAWLEKQVVFNEQLESFGFALVDSFESDAEQGALVLTYSGSLLNIGPLVDGVRLVEYASIGLRKDVPSNAREEASVLLASIAKDQIAEFQHGPIQKSSPVYAVACLVQELAPAEEEMVLGNVTMALTKDFIEINKTIITG